MRQYKKGDTGVAVRIGPTCCAYKQGQRYSCTFHRYKGINDVASWTIPCAESKTYSYSMDSTMFHITPDPEEPVKPVKPKEPVMPERIDFVGSDSRYYTTGNSYRVLRTEKAGAKDFELEIRDDLGDLSRVVYYPSTGEVGNTGRWSLPMNHGILQTEVSGGASGPCVLSELEIPSATDWDNTFAIPESIEINVKQENIMLKIEDTTLVNNTDIRNLTVGNLIGTLKAEREGLATLLEDLGTEGKELKNLEALVKPYKDNINRLLGLIDAKAGELNE